MRVSAAGSVAWKGGLISKEGREELETGPLTSEKGRGEKAISSSILGKRGNLAPEKRRLHAAQKKKKGNRSPPVNFKEQKRERHQASDQNRFCVQNRRPMKKGLTTQRGGKERKGGRKR